MELLHAVLLALVQGLTEFLPISSSAHLILVPRFLGWPDQGLAFDVAVHLGTLLAVVAYFRREVAAIARACLGAVAGRPHDARDARLGWGILLGTLPLVGAGLLLEDLVENELRSPRVIAAATAVFGLLLWVADRRPDRVRAERGIGLGTAVAIGLAQAIALIPGTSRSGITMTAALALGLDRPTAARFSFLLAIPAIAGAGLLETLSLATGAAPVDWVPMLVGLGVAAASAYLCIATFLAAIQRIGMLPFVVYRLVLAGVIWFAFRPA